MCNDEDVPFATVADLRELLESPAESPVLYIKQGPDFGSGYPSLEVWADAYVANAAIVLRRHELIDMVGEHPDDKTLTDALDEIQADVDEVFERL